MAILILIIIHILLPYTIDSISGQNTTQVRLADGTNSSGRIEIFYKSQWSTLYGGSITQNNAVVFCRMLGFNDSKAVSFWQRTTGLFGRTQGVQIVEQFHCLGNETDISQCTTRSNWAAHNTRVPSDIDVEISCEAPLLRLADGDTPASGRVEVNINNQWYTVCDTGFGPEDASLVCRLLGYGNSNVSTPFPDGHYGQGVGGVVVSGLACTGGEASLTQCPGAWGTSVSHSMCDHRSDAGVNCGKTQIRLVDGPTKNSGRVEVLHAGKWGTVCASSSQFSRQNVQVICRSLGINNPNAFGFALPVYGEGYTHVGLLNLDCDGSEMDIANCKTAQWVSPYATTSRCTHKQDATVNCDGRSMIRLVDGDSDQSGRVEIFAQNNWGSISDYGFDRRDLQVICRMLGYEFSEASFFKTGAYYGQGIGKQYVSNLQCNGDETDIGLCAASWSFTSVDHTHDVGVSCDGVVEARTEGGSSNSSGRAMFMQGGYFKSICSSGFDRNDLIVVCRMLGFENVARTASWRTVVDYNQGLGLIGASDLACDGTEISITQCRGTFPANSRCTHKMDVHVNCLGTSELIRLVNGTTDHSGRVEVNIAGSWGTICGSTGFTREDAVVICRMTGYDNPSKVIAYPNANTFGRGTGPIAFNQLRCNGLESSLEQCDLSTDTHYCSHAHDIGVDCCHTNDCDIDPSALVG